MKIWLLCLVKTAVRGGVFAFCPGRVSGEQNIIMKAHYGDWGLRFFEVSQLSEKASDVHQLQ